MRRYVAVDLGAESGRVMLGTLGGGSLALEELHRFPNQPVRLPTGLYWDTLRLFHEIGEGLRAASRTGDRIDGIGIDTWGVDFALLDGAGALAGNPVHYRDSRNNGMVERTAGVAGREAIFEQTGVQFMQINTLCQLHGMKLAASPELASARTLLFMPDLFAYFLSGVAKAELTIASTSQFYDPRRRAWAEPLFDALGLPKTILPEIVSAGQPLGSLLPAVAEATGLAPGTPVIATAGHDTAAAVAAVPAGPSPDWCYISSGTWSLMGVERSEPVITPRSLALNFTNEVGVEGRIRLLKNIMGLWPLQECRRAWAQQGKGLDYEALATLAAAAEPFFAVIDPDSFLEPGRMPERIAAWCRERGQRAPESPGQFTRVILESLALRYRQVLESLEELSGHPIGVIHIVGGGSRNELLNQMVADCTGRTVVAGPAEATAIGNVLTQATGGRLEEIRAVVRAGFTPETIKPRPSPGWDEAYRKFRALTGPGNGS